MTPIDRIAATNRWRGRPLVEKALLGLGLLALALALPPWPAAPAILVVATLVVTRGAGVPLATWAKILAAPLGFVLTGAATLIVTVGDHGVALAPGGLAAASALTLRATAAIAGLLTLTLTTPATDLVAALRRVGVPAEIVEIALLTHRFLLVAGDTAQSMNAAQAARLGHVDWKRRIRSTGMLAANLLPRTLDRAHRLEQGLAARGWTGASLAVLRPEPPVSIRRLAAILALLVALALFGCLVP
ncbi:MAG: cobalt ECF transporter T component CbiQ [Hyphomicrobiales bacterium]|nr:cobalt ECF transporter T component CbiQ [Hyphomicrobiales bacterium]